MSLQLSIVLLLVSAAGVYLIWQMVRAWSGNKGGCGGGCECPSKSQQATKPTLIPTDDLLSRFRQE